MTTKYSATPAAAADKKLSRHDMRKNLKSVRDIILIKSKLLFFNNGCQQDHQTKDWALRKTKFEVLIRNKLRAYFYTDEEMLAAYPCI